MFPSWLQPHRRRQFSPADSPRTPRHYSCTSFKDVQDLLNEDLPPEPNTPKRPSLLHRVRCFSVRDHAPRAFAAPKAGFAVEIPNADHRGVVLYFTSLRIVRKTFEECRSVRSMLRGFRIPIDERDLTMDSNFQDELQAIFGTKNVALPKVFIGGRYVGGAEEIKRMQESDELRRVIGKLKPSDGAISGICGACGGLRFVMCERCDGSHKIYSEKRGFKSCTACNSYGLVKCPACFPTHRRRTSS
ncbi:PREDICTED: uncharacterized protein At5g39865-like [Tarenaya hassleriana]|uniref:uncharacterized protein At5g39865-like n=1 Tax=Tarenaya hassleriana TaxID=28532 RepID=UPI00053C4D3A|nr:PREDICTED: uncharacterized protein At5g39865-like [Tarenaya hassleriana]